MKKTFAKNSGSKLMIALVTATIISAIAPAKSIANNDSTIKTVLVENTSSVQFAGTENNTLLFNVKIDNAAGEKFTLVVNNEEGEIVFLKGYTDKSFSKQIKLMKTTGSNYHFSIWRAGETSDNNKLVEVINAVNF